jgi:hypothetical protein
MGRGLAAMLVTAAVGAVLVAATGVAAVKTKSASIELDAGERGSVTAECKRRSRVVSGGFDVDTDDLTRVPVSKREGKRGWTTTATPSGLDPATLTTYAYCDRSAPRLKARSATVPVAGPVTNVSVKCKRGSEVFAGGFESDGESFPVTSMRAGKRTWTATGNTFPDTSLTAFAYCDRSQPGLKTKSETEQLGSFELGSATAKCKRGTTAVSGGFDSPDPEVMAAGFPGPLVLVNESRREGKRRWTATGTAGFGGGSLTVYAYCEKKRNK